MLQRAGCQIIYRARMPAPIILTLKPRQGIAQQIERERFSVEPRQGMLEYEDSHGNIIHRFKLREGMNTIRYDSLIWVPSAPENPEAFGPPVPIEQLPDSVLRYTLPSRYCDSDKLLDFAFEHFGQVAHGAERVQAICDWVHKNIEYRTFSGSPVTSASDIIAQRYGVCRDFAHTAIALCRTFNLPCALRFRLRARHRCRGLGHAHGFPRVFRGLPRRPVARFRRAVQLAAHRPGQDRPRPRRGGRGVLHDLRRGALGAVRGLELPDRPRRGQRFARRAGRSHETLCGTPMVVRPGV